MSSSQTLIIDYSILLVRKFVEFLISNNMNVDLGVQTNLSAIRNQAFIIKKHSLWQYRRAISEWRLLSTNMSYEEKKMVLLLLGMNLFSQNGVSLWQAACFFHRLPSQTVQTMEKFLDPENGLIRSGILMVLETDLSRNPLTMDDFANLYNNKKVFLSPISINQVFKSVARGGTAGHVTGLFLLEKYKNIDMLLSDISSVMKYIFFLSQFYKLNYPYSITFKENVYETGDFARILQRFKKNIIKSGLNIQLVDFLKAHSLNNISFVILLFMIYRVVITKEVMINNIEEILSQLAFIPSQIRLILQCFNRDSVFVKENFVQQSDYYPPFPFDEDEMDDGQAEADENPNDLDGANYIGISSEFNALAISKEKIYQLIFSDIKARDGRAASRADSQDRLEDMLDRGGAAEAQRNRGLFEIIVPTVTINNVILDEDVKKELLDAVDLTKAVDTMKKWGVRPNLSAHSFGSIKILLYGASGTGKTITAQALAGEAGAELFKVDASNLVSSWVGESTKNVKKVFKEYYRYVKGANKRVFLFMNEADQLLSARGAVMQAADKEYNQMQNILLEELENFDGVFIATTNLVDLFDSAWNRRFNIKIRFEVPKFETRLRLWQVHLSDKMPLAPDVNLYKLAEYELAGGSIANVVYNAARRAALRDGELKVVSQKDFIDAINSELKTHIGGKAGKVGFSR